MLGKIEKGMTEGEMVGWHRQPNGHEFGSTLRDGDGQGSLACCCPWDRKKSDTTELTLLKDMGGKAFNSLLVKEQV